MFTLDFAHFANGNGTTSDLVFVNVAPQPVRPALYFYDTEGNPIAAESVVDITGDLEISEDGGLTVLTEMEPLGELTIATHGQGDLVSGSVKVASEGLIGGMLRFDLPGIGEAVVEASPPISDALFPVRRREGGITTGVAIHNLESSPGLVRCDLLREGVLRDAASLPLEANGQTSWLIDQAFPGTDTSDFAGSVHAIHFLDHVIKKFPFRIHTVRTDRGYELQAQFHWHLADQGIQHVYIKARTPQLNGKVERSHRTDKQAFCQLLTYTDDVDLHKKLSEWETFYNYQRPHGALQGKTPYEALREKLQ